MNWSEARQLLRHGSIRLSSWPLDYCLSLAEPDKLGSAFVLTSQLEVLDWDWVPSRKDLSSKWERVVESWRQEVPF